VLPSGRPGYGGLAALEMLYHEGAHVQSADALEAAIARRLKATGKSGDSELWHVLLFHTVGAAVADVLERRDGIAYEPYADKVGLMQGPWAEFQPLIEADWKPYLAGRESLDEALDRMVAKLPRNRRHIDEITRTATLETVAPAKAGVQVVRISVTLAELRFPPARARRAYANVIQSDHCTASFGDGCGPDLAQNFHHGASPEPLPPRKRLFG
jgi:hypothetical protein